MQQTYDTFYQRVLKDEGTGYEDVAGDNGGPTCCGITIIDVARFSGLKLKFDKQGHFIRGAGDWDKALALTKAINPSTAAPIYKKFYWDACRADDLPAGPDYMTVDFAVNSGVGRSVPTLGRLVGVAGSIVSDKMLAAVKTYGRLDDLINHYQDARQAYLIAISDPNSDDYAHNYRFRAGWLARVARVRETSLALARASQQVEPENPQVVAKLMPKAMPKVAPPTPTKLAVAAKSKSAWYASASGLTGLGAKIKFITGGIAIAFGQALQNAPQIVSDANENKQTFVDLGNTIGTPEIVGGVLTIASIAFLLVAIYRHVDLKQTAIEQGVQTK